MADSFVCGWCVTMMSEGRLFTSEVGPCGNGSAITFVVAVAVVVVVVVVGSDFVPVASDNEDEAVLCED